LLKREPIGAILVEPVQGRGGIRPAPHSFLRKLRRLCDEHRALLILDEIYTGFGRTGRWFACEHSGVIPDLICLGKALTGGFPLSACVGRADWMDAWPPSNGEAIHTSTYLGHPVGCAMALAQIKEIQRLKLVRRSEQLGTLLLTKLRALTASRCQLEARGQGLMAGLELRDSRGRPATDATIHLVQRLLQRGYIFLPEGEHGNILGWTPPLTITKTQLLASVEVVEDELRRLA
jgi:4-aminobutyrate aminotransferase-like enzyme